jgi:hypothetical protein
MTARLAMMALLGVTSVMQAQRSRDAEKPPFAAGAVIAGVLGFARPPINTGVVGGYGYAPVHDFLIGVQGGGTIGDRGRSNASYGLATVGYAFSRGERRQVYPFVGVGGGVLRAHRGPNYSGLLGGAGFGADILLGAADHGLVLGTRAGYVARSVNDDESVAYFVLAFGAGGRAHRPPTIVARR